ncbi:MAG: hypothetical protein V5A61_01235 [Haloarculaceae archaeon]|jgi:hypothetical protein
MGNRRRLKWLLRSKVRSAGRQFEEARRAYREAREETRADLPRDDRGRVRIVCRRYAERRAVDLDADGRPDCFDPDSVDCRGCVEDVREGVIETW